MGDLAETRAIKKVFGNYATNGLMVSSTKSSVGHMLGASGGVELIAVALAITKEVIPATLNLDNPDDECDLDYVPHAARGKDRRSPVQQFRFRRAQRLPDPQTLQGLRAAKPGPRSFGNRRIGRGEQDYTDFMDCTDLTRSFQAFWNPSRLLAVARNPLIRVIPLSSARRKPARPYE